MDPSLKCLDLPCTIVGALAAVDTDGGCPVCPPCAAPFPISSESPTNCGERLRTVLCFVRGW